MFMHHTPLGIGANRVKQKCYMDGSLHFIWILFHVKINSTCFLGWDEISNFIWKTTCDKNLHYRDVPTNNDPSIKFVFYANYK